jgi:hypothetical protein
MPDIIKHAIIERGIDEFQGRINKGINEHYKSMKQMKRASAKKKKHDEKMARLGRDSNGHKICWVN